MELHFRVDPIAKLIFICYNVFQTPKRIYARQIPALPFNAADAASEGYGKYSGDGYV